jgi:hypothetical protein
MQGGEQPFPCGNFSAVSYGFTVSMPLHFLTANGTNCEFTTPITPAWNLLSLPVTPADLAVGKVLAPIMEGLVSVWKWEQGAWAVYLPKENDNGATYAGGKGFGQLVTISPGEGFWVNSSDSYELTIPGVLASGELTLANGWNLVGLKGGQALTVAEITTANPVIISIWKWENGTWAVSLAQEATPGAYALSKGFSVLGTVKPGEGFWVNTP